MASSAQQQSSCTDCRAKPIQTLTLGSHQPASQTVSSAELHPVYTPWHPAGIHGHAAEEKEQKVGGEGGGVLVHIPANHYSAVRKLFSEHSVCFGEACLNELGHWMLVPAPEIR